jgi:GGDEF domain-containing protein
MEIQSEADIVTLVERLKENIEQFNAQDLVPYELGCSIGWDIFDRKSERTVQEFLQNIDRYMSATSSRKGDGGAQARIRRRFPQWQKKPAK